MLGHVAVVGIEERLREPRQRIAVEHRERPVFPQRPQGRPHDGVTTGRRHRVDELEEALQAEPRVELGRRALEALEAVLTGGNLVYRLNPSGLVASGELRLVGELRAEARAWALDAAKRYAGSTRPPELLVPLIYLALIRAGVPIEAELGRRSEPATLVKSAGATTAVGDGSRNVGRGEDRPGETAFRFSWFVGTSAGRARWND